jgi:hypothetical protein
LPVHYSDGDIAVMTEKQLAAYDGSGCGGRDNASASLAAWSSAIRSKLSSQRISVGIIPLSLFLLIARSYNDRPENFAVFLFDYNFGFVRRGLLGAIANYGAGLADYFTIYTVFYWMAAAVFFLAALILLWNALGFERGGDVAEKALFGAVVLLSPMFIKNCLYDFGRVDLLGMACLFVFTVAPANLKRLLILLFPPFLMLCHEGQLFFSVAPMFTVLVIELIHERASVRSSGFFALVCGIFLMCAVSIFILLNWTPNVDWHVMNIYFQTKSQLNTGERSWLLFDSLKDNFTMAVEQKKYAGSQLANLPMYLFAILMHAPITSIAVKFFKNSRNAHLKIAFWLIILTAAFQSITFVLGIDYARHLAVMFMSFIAMALFVVWKYRLAEHVADHVRRYRFVFMALLLVFMPIPRFGIVEP